MPKPNIIIDPAFSKSLVPINALYSLEALIKSLLEDILKVSEAVVPSNAISDLLNSISNSSIEEV